MLPTWNAVRVGRRPPSGQPLSLLPWPSTAADADVDADAAADAAAATDAAAADPMEAAPAGGSACTATMPGAAGSAAAQGGRSRIVSEQLATASRRSGRSAAATPSEALRQGLAASASAWPDSYFRSLLVASE